VKKISIVALAGALALGGCTGTATIPTPPPLTSTSTPVAAPSAPTRTPTPFPETILDGDCSALFDAASAGTFLHTGPLTPTVDAVGFMPSEQRAAAIAGGGLGCTWGEAVIVAFGYYGRPGMSALVLPRSLLPAFQQSSACTSDAGMTQCAIGIIEGGFAMYVSLEIESPDVVEAQVTSTLREALASNSPDTAQHATEKLDCDALARDADLASAMGTETPLAATRVPAPASTTFLENAVPLDACAVSGTGADRDIQVTVQREAASLLDELAASSGRGMHPVTGLGDAAYRSAAGVEVAGSMFFVGDGGDLVETRYLDADNDATDALEAITGPAVAAVASQR
jgi:hypothetical protein